MPERIAEILAIADILAGYGRHLLETLERRAASRNFATIAQFFGTAVISTITAHLIRGIMRAVALEKMLRKRAALGIDLKILAPRRPARRRAPPRAAAASADGSCLSEFMTDVAGADTVARPRRRPAREPLTLANRPGMRQIEAEVRRRPVGQTIVDICTDLGVMPGVCTGLLWNRIFDAIRCYRGSFGNIMLERQRREKRFDKEQWQHPELALPEQDRDAIRQVVGFFVGEPMINPFRVAPAPGTAVAVAATGPP